MVNRGRVLASLRQQGAQSRTQIGAQTGLSAATVTQVTADLITEKVLHELTADAEKSGGKNVSGRRGRPRVMLDFRQDAATIAVVSLQVNVVDICFFDYSGSLVHHQHEQFATRNLTGTELLKRLKELLDAALATKAHYRKSLKHIALACQGVVNEERGQLLWSPMIKVSDINLREPLQTEYSVPVSVGNDCNMIATALRTVRQSTNSIATDVNSTDDNFAAVLVSYGLGLGIFHKGSILTGSYSSGTEFGHMLLEPDGALCRCGKRGCIEAYSSDYAVLRRATGQPDDAPPADNVPLGRYEELVDAASRGPGSERLAFESAGAAIGQGLSNLYALFDPFPAVLVGPSERVFNLMKPGLVDKLDHYREIEHANLVSSFDQQTDLELIRAGTLEFALAHIDREVFGFSANRTLLAVHGA